MVILLWLITALVFFCTLFEITFRGGGAFLLPSIDVECRFIEQNLLESCPVIALCKVMKSFMD